MVKNKLLIALCLHKSYCKHHHISARLACIRIYYNKYVYGLSNPIPERLLYYYYFRHDEQACSAIEDPVGGFGAYAWASLAHRHDKKGKVVSAYAVNIIMYTICIIAMM